MASDFKNIFVLCAGRCGSTTFIKACEYITNYSASHESRCSKLGDERVSYPANHIEADNRLSWFLGRLGAIYADEAVYVHLFRDENKIAESYNRRWTHPKTIVRGYANSILLSDDLSLEVCKDYVRTVSENISYFLRDKTHVFHVDIESPREGFAEFWSYINAEGDMDAALAQFDSNYNPSLFEANDFVEVTDPENKAIESIERVINLGYQERTYLRSLLSEQKRLADKKHQELLKSKELTRNLEITLGLKFQSEIELRERELDLCLDEKVRIIENSAELEKYTSSLLGDYQELIVRHQEQFDDYLKLVRTHNASISQLERLKASKPFHLGHAIMRNLKSPIGWFKIPFSVVRALTSQRIVQPKLASVSRPDIKKPKAFKDVFKRRRYRPNTVIVESAKISQTSFEEAEAFVFSNGVDQDKLSFNVIRANRSIESNLDELHWLKYLNSYLSQFRISPLHLASTEGHVFSRLECDIDYAIDDPVLISVIMPAYNAADQLHHAAHSILRQTWKNVQLIIVDDCSEDNTWDIIKSLQAEDSRVLGVRNSVNVGPYVSKNRALKYVKGKYFTGQDADDWSHPQRLERQLASLRTNRSFKAVISYMLRIRPNGKMDYFNPVGKISFDGVAKSAPISCFFETDYFINNLGAWDSVRYGADTELIGRFQAVLGSNLLDDKIVTMICQDIEGSLTNDPVTGVRVEGEGLSSTRRAYRDSYKAWHSELEQSGATSCVISTLEPNRPFSAPQKMLVPEELQKIIYQDK